MRFYTATEIMHILQLTNRQLQRLLVTCSIHYHAHPRDARLKLLTEDEFIQVQQQQQHERLELGQLPDADEVAELRAKVAALEAQLAVRQKRQDEQQVSRVDTVSLPPTTEHRAPQRGRGGFPQDAIPAGYVYLHTFAVAHGVPKATAWGHVAAGHITETTAPIAGRRERHHYLTAEQQQEAVTYWRRVRGDDFQECGAVACSCHES